MRSAGQGDQDNDCYSLKCQGLGLSLFTVWTGALGQLEGYSNCNMAATLALLQMVAVLGAQVAHISMLTGLTYSTIGATVQACAVHIYIPLVISYSAACWRTSGHAGGNI